jgi:hypothetical protein
MDSQHERDTEHETGHEEMVSEKAASKAQQRFFGMVHAMQKGKKVSGASSELKGVAKGIGKKDAKDFAKTKHKGLPDHVDETSFEDQGISEESKGLWANIHAKQQRIKNGSGEHMRKPGSKGAPTKDALSKAKTEDVAEGFPAYAKGNKKFGKDGMQKLRDKEAAGASKKEMQATRDEFNKYKKKEVDEAKDLPGKRDNLDVAKPKGKLTKADFEALRAKKKVKESTDMKQLTEGAMKDLLINFYDDVTKHKGDGSVFDLRKAQNVQQAEEILKALVKHGDEYDGLDVSNQNELVNQTLKYLAHEKELPFNTFAGVDKQRFTNQTPNNLSGYRQHPGAKPGSNFSKPGSSMAVPRTTSSTGSNGFLKTLSTPTTFNESNDMKDKQFESWEQELNSLLTEGITVSHSTGQQGSPDSLSINATEHDAGELMSILRNSGMEMFGGKQQEVGYGGPEHGGEEGGEEFHQGIEIAPSPEVVGDGDDMLALIKKMSGIESDSNTPGSVEVDYEDEEDNDKEGHDEECDDCGHSPCSCNDEEVDENLVPVPNPSGANSADRAKELGSMMPNPAGSTKDPISELTAEYPGGSTPLPEDEMDEGNEFSGELAKAKAQHKDHFSVDGKEYPVKEDDMDEGNMFTGNLAKARAQGKSHADLDGDGDMEKVQEGEEDCMECGYPMESCGCEQVEEGYANDAGGNAMGDTELLQLKELLGRGNDLHRQKHTQATGNIQKVTMETKLLKDSTSLLQDFRKLSGIK